MIICERRQDGLKEVADKFPALITKVCDLSVEAGRIELYNWIAENHSDLNVLVNNAGIPGPEIMVSKTGICITSYRENIRTLLPHCNHSHELKMAESI